MLYLLGFFRFKWTYLVAGILFLAVGTGTYATAHPTQPVEIDGTESSYVEVTKNNSYDHNELQVTGDNTTYTLDKGVFHPTLPDQVWKGGKMRIWIDQGSTTIVAIMLYDEQDTNPIKYTTTHYDNPHSGLTDAQGGGLALGAIGLAGIGVFALWIALTRRRGGAQPAAGFPMVAPMPVSSTSVGLSPNGKWFWDGVQWREVSPDGRYRWDGARWRELGPMGPAVGAPPPPPS